MKKLHNQRIKCGQFEEERKEEVSEDEAIVSGHLDSKDAYTEELIQGLSTVTLGTVVICLHTDKEKWHWPLWQINFLSAQNFYNLKFTTS